MISSRTLELHISFLPPKSHTFTELAFAQAAGSFCCHLINPFCQSCWPRTPSVFHRAPGEQRCTSQCLSLPVLSPAQVCRERLQRQRNTKKEKFGALGPWSDRALAWKQHQAALSCLWLHVCEHDHPTRYENSRTGKDLIPPVLFQVPAAGPAVTQLLPCD